MAGPKEIVVRGAGGSGEAQAQGQPRDSAMAPMQPSLGPPMDVPRVFGLDKFNGDNFAEWSFKMDNIFYHYDLLEVMEGTEKRPENDPEKSPWVRKSAQGYLLLGQALGSSQIRHIKPFQHEPEKGTKARAALKGVHAPATAAVAVVLERQMAALRIEEDEAVEEGLQQFFDLLTRLDGADLNCSELQKKTKLLALLPESWSSFIINLNRDLPRLSLEDVKRAILQEDFRRATTSKEAAGADTADMADTALTKRATDAVVVDSTASATIVTRADICGAIATSSVMDELLLKSKRVEEQEEGKEEAVEAVGVVEVELQTWRVPATRASQGTIAFRRAEVKGMGKAMFKGADGKMVGLKNAEGSAPAGPSGSGGMRGAGEAGRSVAGGSAPIDFVSIPGKDDVKALNLEKFSGEDWASWSFKMELLFNHYGLLEDVHAPSSEAMVVVLERQLHAVRINEGDAVQGAFDQLWDFYVKLSAADVDYPEKIKCYKALCLLPESWGPLVVNFNGMKDSWSLEWICAQVLQEEFRRKELTAAAGEGGGSAYGMKVFKGRCNKKGKAKEGSGEVQYSGGKRSNKRGKRCGGKCWYCHVEGHPWIKCRKLPDGWRPVQPSIEGSKCVHGAMGVGMGSEEGDGGARGHGGMFYHVGEACLEDMVVPASKVALHRSSHWVIATGAFMTMTNREDLQDEVRPSKSATVVSATGQVVPVRGKGRAMFIGMKMEMMGTKVFKATLDGRVLWDLRGGKGMHQSMWEIPVLPWKEVAARLAAEAVRGGHASQITSGGGGDGSDGGLLVHGGGTLPSVTPSTGETDWLTAHRRFGHVALPHLQQLFKEERVKGLRIKGEPKEVGSCETCLTSKFSRFPFHSTVGQSSDPVELVHVDLVGPMKVKGDGGALYSMTMVDDFTRLT
ncbi:unnamed protein product, partial [Closterium sp. NIES-54]